MSLNSVLKTRLVEMSKITINLALTAQLGHMLKSIHVNYRMSERYSLTRDNEDKCSCVNVCVIMMVT